MFLKIPLFKRDLEVKIDFRSGIKIFSSTLPLLAFALDKLALKYLNTCTKEAA